MREKLLELTEIIQAIRPIDLLWIGKARERTAQLVMPTRALGRLHDISERLCGIQRTLEPITDRKAILVMAGDHGVVAEGVSAYPQVITGEMVRTFLRGGAGINAITAHVGAEVWVVDMGIIPDVRPTSPEGVDRLWIRKVARGTANLARGPAMSPQQAQSAVLEGFQLASKLFGMGVQVLGTGDMGIGNTTPSTAIAAVLTGEPLENLVGRGTGLDDHGIGIQEKDLFRDLPILGPGDLDVLEDVAGGPDPEPLFRDRFIKEVGIAEKAPARCSGRAPHGGLDEQGIGLTRGAVHGFGVVHVRSLGSVIHRAVRSLCT